MSNVVRLPTAARRQVQQRKNKDARAARVALREACPWPGQYVAPWVREADRKAEAIRRIERTPGLLIALTVLQAIPEAQRAHAMLAIERLAGTGDQAAIEATALATAVILRAADMEVLAKLVQPS